MVEARTGRLTAARDWRRWSRRAAAGSKRLSGWVDRLVEAGGWRGRVREVSGEEPPLLEPFRRPPRPLELTRAELDAAGGGGGGGRGARLALRPRAGVVAPLLPAPRLPPLEVVEEDAAARGLPAGPLTTVEPRLEEPLLPAREPRPALPVELPELSRRPAAVGAGLPGDLRDSLLPWRELDPDCDGESPGGTDRPLVDFGWEAFPVDLMGAGVAFTLIPEATGPDGWGDFPCLALDGGFSSDLAGLSWARLVVGTGSAFGSLFGFLPPSEGLLGFLGFAFGAVSFDNFLSVSGVFDLADGAS